jgi:hypothetical protein
MIQILGKLIVPTPGTPVRATSMLSPEEAPRFTCHGVLFQAMASNTGKVYIGKDSMNKSTLADCAAVLAIPTANIIPGFGISHYLAPAAVDISELWIDADQANEGVLITVLIT